MQSITDRISRWWHSLGFGIQSPWAYSLVTDVIAEKLPYYDYRRIDREFSLPRERRRQKLFLRLRNRYPQCRFYAIDDLPLSGGNPTDGIMTDGVFVLTGIRTSEHTFRQWLAIRDSDAIGITFDLYDLALCFPEEGRIKQHYKLKY